jgi:periplasmic divalent cation tolerance protein
MDTEFVEIQITCGSDDEALTIADALVGHRLAACVQHLPIRSTYRWQGTVENDDEILLLVKTTAG